MDGQKKPSRVLRWLLIVSLVVILNLFFNFAIKLFYEPPTYEAFCPVRQMNVPPQTAGECVAEGGGWTNYGGPQPQAAPPDARKSAVRAPEGYCNLDFTCSRGFETARSLYNRNVFVALIVLGVLSLIAGFFLSISSAVSLGLSLGGVLSLVIAAARYWSDMHDYLRVIILGAALAVLIIFGVRKLRD